MRRLRSSVVVAASSLVAFALVSPTAAAAPERTSSLSWVRMRGAESCIGTRTLAQAVEARLHRAVFVSASQAEISIEGRVEKTQDPEGFRASITISNASGAILGARELTTTAPSCGAMDEELAIVIAVMIDPDAALSATAPSPVVAPPPAPPVITIPISVPAQPPQPLFVAPVSPPWRVHAGAGPAFSLGLLPSVGAGLRLRAEIMPPGFRTVMVEGTYWATAHAQQGTSGATLSLATGALSLCPIRIVVPRSRLLACGGIEVGAMRSGGFGFDVAEEHERGVLNAVLTSRVERRLIGPIAVGIGLGLVIPTIRDQYFYGEANGTERDVFRMSPIAATLDVDLGVEFP
jgi:hypothetical protein